MNNIIEITIWHPAQDAVLTDAVPMGPRVIHIPEREQRGLLNLSEFLYAECKIHTHCTLDRSEQKTVEYWLLHMKDGSTIKTLNFDRAIKCEKQV